MASGDIQFSPRGDVVSELQLPCGQCIGCRLERSRQWAIRCVHEASLHDRSCFVTLTYDDAHLPSDCGLRLRDFQLFMKRLRKKFGPCRFFHCGEYGDVNFRPHYHAILFGVDFNDKIQIKGSGDFGLYFSQCLADLWGHGLCSVGPVSFESAAYVARYSLKKISGPGADEHYTRIDTETGEIVRVASEYVTMSRRPGIAADWFRKYSSDVYPSDEVISRGRSMRPPRFYDKLLERVDPLLLEDLKFQREVAARESVLECWPDRLAVREAVARAKLGLSKRSV